MMQDQMLVILLSQDQNLATLLLGKMLYLKLDIGAPGRAIWVPLSGPLNPSNLAIGSGHFCQVSRV